ncbi:MAG: hypothetical protein IPK53_08180 [bacterium]|nr:hypothetical protein [bacterium]
MLAECLNKQRFETGRKELFHLFSLRHEFASEWHRFLVSANANGDHVQTFTLTKNHFPILFQEWGITIESIELFGVPKANQQIASLPAVTSQQQPVKLKEANPIGRLIHKVTDGWSSTLDKEAHKFDLTLTVVKTDVQEKLEPLENIFVVCNYKCTSG